MLHVLESAKHSAGSRTIGKGGWLFKYETVTDHSSVVRGEGFLSSAVRHKSKVTMDGGLVVDGHPVAVLLSEEHALVARDAIRQTAVGNRRVHKACPVQRDDVVPVS